MDNVKIESISLIINELVNDISEYIVNTTPNTIISEEIIEKSLLSSYLKKLISKGEYAANDYLLEIKNMLYIYKENKKGNIKDD
ncbi:hypothetical protein JEP40_09575, partial [Proteus vulgaris]|uniref:hypothetical protein n=1 Tax=Proteus vulgaris TaxID=585 RepID=UPI0018E48963